MDHFPKFETNGILIFLEGDRHQWEQVAIICPAIVWIIVFVNGCTSMVVYMVLYYGGCTRYSEKKTPALSGNVYFKPQNPAINPIGSMSGIFTSIYPYFTIKINPYVGKHLHLAKKCSSNHENQSMAPFLGTALFLTWWNFRKKMKTQDSEGPVGSFTLHFLFFKSPKTHGISSHWWETGDPKRTLRKADSSPSKKEGPFADS